MRSRLCLLAVPLALSVLSCERTPPALATVPAAELASFAGSSNALGLDLYARARKTPGNVALSPLAISNALVALWAGARGETGAQIQKAFHAKGTSEAALDTAGRIDRDLAAHPRDFTFRAAERLFVDKGQAIEPAYTARLERAFGTRPALVDFGADPEAARRTVNDWIAERTEGRLGDLVPAGTVDRTTTTVIASTLYFRGPWKTRFSPRMTETTRFYLTSTVTKDVSMMHQKTTVRANAMDGVTVAELPYEGGDLAMTLVVPDTVEGLPTVEARLSPAALDQWIAALAPQELDVYLPRFEITPHLPLKDELEELGMTLAFDRDRADFTGIAPKGIFVDRLSHAVYVKVDEAGTEAAAFTWGTFTKAAPPELRADHPFLFFIREVRSGLILFLGRVSDPTQR